MEKDSQEKLVEALDSPSLTYNKMHHDGYQAHEPQRPLSTRALRLTLTHVYEFIVTDRGKKTKL